MHPYEQLLLYTRGHDNIAGYQSRIVVAADGALRLTEIGEYLENDSSLARSCHVINTPLVV